MTRDDALEELQALGDEKVRERNRRNGVEDQYGVKLGDIRKVAKRIETDHDLAAELWATGNLEARLLAVLLLKPRQVPAATLDAMVRSVRATQVADWLNAYVVRKHPEREDLRRQWLDDEDPMVARSAWDLTAERVAKQPDGLDLDALLDRIEQEMQDVAEVQQWTMNTCLAAIGIGHAAQRARAIAIGEDLGVYRDYPTPKGCTSPFAPLWIEEMVARQTV